MIKTGYIVGPRSDAVWFVALPFAALLIGLACQQWLSAVAVTSVALLITGPHHFVTLFRTFGLSEDRHRFADRLIVGLIVITAIIAAGTLYAPLTLVLLTVMWNQQHSMMQIHGFSRIYDFKAGSGYERTGRWDFWLNLVLYANLFITVPPLVNFWVRELHRFGIPISSAGVQVVHQVSWTITIAACVVYLGHHWWLARRGYGVNPMKLLFLACSYGVLYVAGFHAASVLVFAITAQIIHGVQYIVIVYYFVRRKTTGEKPGLLSFAVRPGNAVVFVSFLIAYAVAIQMIGGRSFDELTFGLVTSMTNQYPAVSSIGVGAFTTGAGDATVGTIIVSIPGLLHLYYDSFIWKVREKKIHGGL